jgi:hypothetical protein
LKQLTKSRSANEPGEARLTLVELAQRPYPPLARQTRITGDVEPGARQDCPIRDRDEGTSAAHEGSSGQRAEFPIRLQNVWWGTNTYKITYTFQLSDSQGCCIAPANASPVHSDLPARGVKQLGNPRDGIRSTRLYL